MSARVAGVGALAWVVGACTFPATIVVGVPDGTTGGDGGQMDVACPSGQIACSGVCSIVANDPMNCGRCAHPCSNVGGAGFCASGVCMTSCTSPNFDCDHDPATGCEANVQNDPRNCGACGRVCPSGPNQTATCTLGVCSKRCMAGRGDCDGNPSNGCETDLSSTMLHCGACGATCVRANANTGCMLGVCRVTSCALGFGDCNHSAGDGCEANLNTENANCGACGSACSTTNVCSNGSCSASCGAGQMNCAGCIDVTNDPHNCGMCSHVCSGGPNGIATCVSMQCGLRCTPGFLDCDGQAATGCEISGQTDPSNCGACNMACPSPANSRATCSGGACGITCASGFGNCDGLSANGCETSLTSDSLNCGACGTACGAGLRCAGGMCVCAVGEVMCFGVCANLNSDSANCGQCASPCPAGDVCQSGACVIGCQSPRMMCGMNCIDVTMDSSNCGGCGHVCGGGQFCSGGTCVCPTNTMPCGSNCVNTMTDIFNCGTCGTVCADGASCLGGTCMCAAGLRPCGPLGAQFCTDTSSDPSNCGACSHACPVGICDTGVCTNQ